MALPTMSVPTFKTKIPSTGKQVTYRPFLVKEEKILLMALEGGDMDEISEATKTILENCILDEIDVEKLATFDVEYLFLQLRSKSISEVIELVVGHTKESECTHRTEVSFNIDDIKVKGIKKNRNIQITDSIGIKVRYPSMQDVQKLKGTEDAVFKVIASCIEVVYDSDNVYDEFSQQEIEEWLDGLSQVQFKKVSDFFSDTPKLSYDVKWKCPQCGEEDEFKLEGLQSFFMWR
jgi:hypothetical protein